MCCETESTDVITKGISNLTHHWVRFPTHQMHEYNNNMTIKIPFPNVSLVWIFQILHTIGRVRFLTHQIDEHHKNMTI